YFKIFGGEGDSVHLSDAFLPFVVLLIVLVLLHLLIALLLPLRWPAIRAEFHRQLGDRLRHELETAYTPLPVELAHALLTDRREADKVIAEAREVAVWLQGREQTASIAGLYGA